MNFILHSNAHVNPSRVAREPLSVFRLDQRLIALDVCRRCAHRGADENGLSELFVVGVGGRLVGQVFQQRDIVLHVGVGAQPPNPPLTVVLLNLLDDHKERGALPRAVSPHVDDARSSAHDIVEHERAKVPFPVRLGDLRLQYAQKTDFLDDVCGRFQVLVPGSVRFVLGVADVVEPGVQLQLLG